MDDLKALGDLLKLPRLEGDTVALINSKMRDMVAQVVVLTPEQRAIQDEIDRQMAKSLLDEWTGGKVGDNDGSS